MRVFKVAAVAFFFVLPVALLPACGGGSDTGQDATSVKVISTSPNALATGVEIDQPIRVTFSETVDPASLTNLSFIVTGPGGNIMGNIAVVGNVATYTASGPFAHDSQYTATVTTAVQGAPPAANSLVADFSWTFATRTPWTYLLGSVSGDFGTGVASDSTGNVYVTGYSDGDLDGNVNAGGVDLILTKYDADGVKQWTREWGTASFEHANGVTTDSNGNIYVTGDTGGDLDGNATAGGLDVVLAKYDASGVRQWTRQWGSSADDSGLGVKTDSHDNVYVTGFTEGDLDGNTSAGGRDLFLTKYDPSGTRQWTRQLGTVADDYGRDVAIDGTGNVYVAGDTGGDLDGDLSAGGTDLFLAQYHANGVKQWTRQWGTSAFDNAHGVVVDTSDNVFVGGSTSGDFDGYTNAGGYDLSLTLYSTSGVKQWTRQWGSTDSDLGRDITADASGNVYVVGYTFGDLDGNTNVGRWDLFVTQLNVLGDRQWTRLLGTSDDEEGWGVTTGANGDVYVVGNTRGNLDGNTNAGALDIFVTKYNDVGYKK